MRNSIEKHQWLAEYFCGARSLNVSEIGRTKDRQRVECFLPGRPHELLRGQTRVETCALTGRVERTGGVRKDEPLFPCEELYIKKMVFHFPREFEDFDPGHIYNMYQTMEIQDMS